MDRRQIGRTAEDIAADFLERNGAAVCLRNYRCKLGELDLIAHHGNTLVVAEVRTRASDTFGGAAESIDAWKRHCIIRTTQHLLQRRKEFANLPVRFDVLLVSDVQEGRGRVEWIRHAFEATEAT